MNQPTTTATVTLSDQLRQHSFNYIEDDPFVAKLINEGVLLSRPETAKLLKISTAVFAIHFRKLLKGFTFKTHEGGSRKERIYFLRDDVEKLSRFSKVNLPKII